MNAPTDWTSAVAILAGGLILGLLFAYLFSRRKASQPIRDNLAFKDLEGKRDALVHQLRELDDSASPEERQRLESETADVLRKLDAQAPSSPNVVSDDAVRPAPLAMNPTIKGFLWGAVSVAALAGLGYFVMQSAKPREEGGQLTGNLPSEVEQRQQAPQQPDAMLAQLLSVVQREPDNLQARNDLAQAYLERENLMAVFEQTKIVLEKAPGDSRALTLQALVRMSMGEAETAETMLKQASKSDPKNLDSWVALAWVYTQLERPKEAEAMIAEAAKQSPGDKVRLEQVYQQMKAQAAGAAAAPVQQAGGELPPGHPPVNGAPSPGPVATATPAPAPAAPMAAADGRSITVTLDLDASARNRGGVLYVMARNPMGGPPVAVKRIMSPTFPTTFTLGQADSMMGQPLPDKFRLEARLDSDGDAATKLPTDPSAVQEGVVAGSSVRLALK